MLHPGGDEWADIVVSHPRKRFIAVSEGRSVRVIDVALGCEIAEVGPIQTTVTAVAFDRTGANLLVVTADERWRQRGEAGDIA
ncbi:MAG: hypothetical protein ACRELB_03405, partial [Polyangiaceae bacterium]